MSNFVQIKFRRQKYLRYFFGIWKRLCFTLYSEFRVTNKSLQNYSINWDTVFTGSTHGSRRFSKFRFRAITIQKGKNRRKKVETAKGWKCGLVANELIGPHIRIQRPRNFTLKIVAFMWIWMQYNQKILTIQHRIIITIRWKYDMTVNEQYYNNHIILIWMDRCDYYENWMVEDNYSLCVQGICNQMVNILKHFPMCSGIKLLLKIFHRSN